MYNWRNIDQLIDDDYDTYQMDEDDIIAELIEEGRIAFRGEWFDYVDYWGNN